MLTYMYILNALAFVLCALAWRKILKQKKEIALLAEPLADVVAGLVIARVGSHLEEYRNAYGSPEGMPSERRGDIWPSEKACVVEMYRPIPNYPDPTEQAIQIRLKALEAEQLKEYQKLSHFLRHNGPDAQVEATP